MLSFEVAQGIHCVGETVVDAFDSSEPFHSLSCISLRVCSCCGEALSSADMSEARGELTGSVCGEEVSPFCRVIFGSRGSSFCCKLFTSGRSRFERDG